MANGFRKGVVTGGVVSVLGLSALSVIAPQPIDRTPPAAPQVTVDQGNLPTTESLHSPEPIDQVRRTEPTNVGKPPAAPDAPPTPDAAPAGTPNASQALPVVIAPAAVAQTANIAEPSATAPSAPIVSIPTPPVAMVEQGADKPQAPAKSPVSSVSDVPARVLAPATKVNETVEGVPGVDAENPVMITPQPAPQVAETAPTDAPEITLETSMVPQNIAAVQTNGVTAPKAEPAPVLSAPEPMARTRQVAVHGALKRYAAPAVEVSGPMVAIVLIDQGLREVRPDNVQALPFPVTVALDASQPGAQDRMKQYRRAGVDVLALSPLTAGQTISETNRVLDNVFAALPEAVGLLDAKGVLNGSGATLTAAMAHLAAQGRGFVAPASSVPNAHNVAEQSGVPAMMIDGQFAENNAGAVLNAALDGQVGDLLLLGEVNPDVLLGLARWGIAQEPKAIAPLSQIMGAHD